MGECSVAVGACSAAAADTEQSRVAAAAVVGRRVAVGCGRVAGAACQVHVSAVAACGPGAVAARPGAAVS